MPFPPRPAQTRVKHEIIHEYSGAWAGIIGNGISPVAWRSGFVLDLVYLEGFAGFGRYKYDRHQPENSNPVWGSPIIALRQLEAVSKRVHSRGIAVRVTGILVDLNQEGQIEELETNLLAARIATPVKRLQNVCGIRKGHVNLLAADFRDHVNNIVDTIDSGDFVLAFLDPYGESMRMHSLDQILGRPKTDSIVLFPTARVDRLSGCVAKMPRDRGPQDYSNIKRIDHLYGGKEWRNIAIESGRTREQREIAFCTLYRNRLKAIDEDLWVKNIALSFPDIGRQAYSLLLATRDADGGMRMNDILRKAEARKHWSMWEDLEAKLRARDARTGQGHLFPEMPLAAPPSIESKPVPKELIMDSIMGVVLPGEALEYKRLLGRLCDTPYRTREINGALRHLRKQGSFGFSRLKKGSTVRRSR